MAIIGTTKKLDMLSRLGDLAHRPIVTRALAIALLVASVLSGFATYLALTGEFGDDISQTTVLLLLILNLVLLLLLGAVVSWQFIALWLERRRGLLGARLHLRLVLWFSLIAMVPTIIISLFSVLFVIFAVNEFFTDQISTFVRSSDTVAKTYIKEQQTIVASSTAGLATELRNKAGDDFNRNAIEQVLTRWTQGGPIDEAVIIDADRNVVASAELSVALQFDLNFPKDSIERARAGQVIVFPSAGNERLRALVKLSTSPESFLLTGRPIAPAVVKHIDMITQATRSYDRLKEDYFTVQARFAFVVIAVALLLLFVAIWAALTVATRIVRPVSTVMAAADQIGSGKLDTRVPEGEPGDALGALGRAFNRMTEQISSQREELVATNRQLEERRRFTEGVLAGVSAGVIGLDDAARINLPNRSASDLLGIDLSTRIGHPIAEIIPEMAPLVESARHRPSWIAESQISLERGAETRTLLVRIVAEFIASRLIGFVVTFDDVTELMSAQRKAAWADVARRIAHEIKNPLTPIQLSAERLKRKYLAEITSDPETFATCTDTIVRQVGDIGRMVDEFSAFARMPAPVMERNDAIELCRQAIFLQRAGNPDIEFATDFPGHPVPLICDAPQIGQALTNLLKNAGESIDGRLAGDDGNREAGRIQISVTESPEDVSIVINDNGRGLPVQGRERLTEPYVTTRARGTGLGLAIVKKIMEDHGGLLALGDREGGGASIRMIFRKQVDATTKLEPEEPAVRAVHGG
jgi:two-component system nitrogen regulation sensor histidine kinase NtrY